MGIDWFRVRVKCGEDRALLGRLIEYQAVAFQSMWGWHSEACGDCNGVQRALQERLHLDSYRAASDALRELLEFPGWDDERGCAVDSPDFAVCWRVYPISKNTIFPPLWRLGAHRTFLHDRLGEQLSQWKTWAEQVARGEQDDYLRELHVYETSDFMRHHWSRLHGAAIASLGRDAAWANKPGLVEVRERILRLPELTVTDAHIDPKDERRDDQEELGARYQALFEQLRTLIDLTRAWDSNVRGNKKIRYYEDYYHLTFDDFKNQARDPWLWDFFEWADRCVALGFGLYLDY